MTDLYRTSRELFGTLINWYRRPAFVSNSPKGMPVTPAEFEAAKLLAREGIAYMNRVGTAYYLRPVEMPQLN